VAISVDRERSVLLVGKEMQDQCGSRGRGSAQDIGIGIGNPWLGIVSHFVGCAPGKLFQRVVFSML
jgi:hypothetical protein